MKKPITIKLFSALLNLLTFTSISLFFLSGDNLHQSGDSWFFFILTLPLAIALALIGRSILNLFRTNDRTLRIFLMLIISILVTTGWICFISYMWGGFQNLDLQILEMPLVYSWVAGSFIQLLFLDRKLPTQTEKTNPVKLIFSILALPIILITLYISILLIGNWYSTSKYSTDDSEKAAVKSNSELINSEKIQHMEALFDSLQIQQLQD